MKSEMSTIAKWSVVIGNGKRVRRKRRKLENLKLDRYSINKKGEIVEEETKAKSSNSSSCGYDLSFQPDMEAGCY